MRTTEAVRRAIQSSRESLRATAARYGVNVKTVRRWRSRPGIEDAPMGPKTPYSTTISKRDEAIAVFLRRHTLLPLDDCLYVLEAIIPVSRSSLYRCYRRHGINFLPEAKKYSRWGKTSRAPLTGCLRLDVSEIRSKEGDLCFFFAIDLKSKFTYGEMHEAATQQAAAKFLSSVIRALPYRIHTVVTNNREPFATLSRGRSTRRRRHSSASFQAICSRNKIQHHITRPDYPWREEQVKRMDLVHAAGARVLYHQTRRQAEVSMLRYHEIYNFGKRLKALKGLTPYEFICRTWHQSPEQFWASPYRHFARRAVGAASF